MTITPIIDKAIIVSTRVPSETKPISGGMAPAVKASCDYFGEAVWFGVGSPQDISKADGRGKASVEFNDAKEVVNHVARYRKEGIEIVQITADEHEFSGHYNRFSNEFLWPLCHDRPDITRTPENVDVVANGTVNNRLARMISDHLNETGDTQTPIWIHDYHHMNLPSLLRANGVENAIIFFNHIPMPSAETLQEAGEETRLQFRSYIRELSHADVVLFQSDITVDRFLDALGEEDVQLAPYEMMDIQVAGRDVTVGNFPISINVPDILKKAQQGELRSEAAIELQDQLVAENLLVDFARADYSKGFVERVQAFKEMMQQRPDLKGKVQLVMGAEPSRTDIDAYIDYVDELKTLVEEVNSDQDLWVEGQPPIVLMNKQIPHEDVVQLLRNDRADQRKIGAITAWRDGMNLVCKEFMMAQDPENAGVLLLSSGTGAGHEKGFSDHAVRYDPQRDSSDNLVRAMIKAIEMPQEEANARARRGQEYLKSFDLGRWALETIKVMQAAQPEDDDLSLERSVAVCPRAAEVPEASK